MRLFTLRAFTGLLMFDVLGFSRNFASLHRCVIAWRVAPRNAATGVVERICQAVDSACALYPKRVLCLQRSAVTTCLLRSSGVPAKMVVGARNLPFKAHAWTEVGGRPVNERGDVQKTFDVLERC